MAYLDQLLGQFGQRVGGLLDPESPQNMTGLMQNPAFNVGMGILAANRDPRQNVFQGAMAGLQSAQEQQAAQEQQQRMEELRQQLAEFFQTQQGQAPDQTAQPGGAMPGPAGLMQQPGMSLTDQLLSQMNMGTMMPGMSRERLYG